MYYKLTSATSIHSPVSQTFLGSLGLLALSCSFCTQTTINPLTAIDAYTRHENSPFHVRLRNVLCAVIERDVTSGVHSCAILGYFTIAANGKSYLLSHVVTSRPRRIF